MIPTTFLVMFILFKSLSLGLKLTCISKKNIMAGLSLVSILILLISFIFIFFD